MHLKRLQLVGFKSFADKTVFDIGPGVTGFVGPNGCGKSNVVDAIKWVLGEQSAKSLRGNEMLDVIFNGTESGRRPVGYAEVAVTFSNDDRSLPVDYEEVTLARRLYRNGDSEYYLNKNLCRLKDIRELLMDTGIGVRAYSVIEQGRIDVLLASSPAERRYIFEEAAGISKYKAKKKETTSRLERTEVNLERLRDVIGEVEKQLRSIKYQAAKARKYKEYAEQLKQMRMTFALAEYHAAESTAKDVTVAIGEVEGARGEQAAVLAEMETRTAEAESRTLEVEQELDAGHAKAAEIETAQTACQEKVTFGRQRMGDLKEQEERLRVRLAEAENAVGEMAREMRELSAEADGVRGKQKDCETELREAESHWRETEAAVREIEKSIERSKAAAVELLHRATAAQNRKALQEAERRSTEARAERIRERMKGLAEEQRQTTEGLDRCAVASRDAERKIEDLKTSLKLSEDEIVKARDGLDMLQSQAAETRRIMDSVVSRREVLRELESKHEGLGPGTRAVLENLASPKIEGVAASLIEVDMPYATAIEHVVAESAEFIVTEDVAAAREAIEYLKTTKSGRAGFLPLTTIRGARVDFADLRTEEGVIGAAIDLVRYQERHRQLVEYLLGDVLLVSGLPTAMELVARHDFQGRVVTLMGDVVTKRGAVTGGTPRVGGGLLSRRSELRDLEEQVTSFSSRMEELGREVHDGKSLLASAEEKATGYRHMVYDASVTKLEAENEMKQRRKDEERLREESSVLGSELGEAERRMEEAAARMHELDGEATRLLEERRSVEAELVAIETRRAERAEAAAEAQARITEARVFIAQITEKLESLDRQRVERRNARDGLKSEVVRIVAEIAECMDKRETAAEAMRQGEKDLERMQGERTELQRRVDVLYSRREELRAGLQTLREEQKEARGRLESIESKLQSLRVEESGLRAKARSLIERSRDEYGFDLEAAYGDYEPESIGDGQAYRNEMQTLREKMERMGNVNLEAIDEQEQLEGRAAEMNEQERDLVRARDSLQEVMRRLNRKSRELFMEAFELIRGHFQETFRKLFGGGRADVYLEGEDVLEAGIEIVARPPGKELRSLTLLSGGEKSMTAVALLFAVFRAKPSPFCILDEVDAALDEGNIGRFVQVLKEYTGQSQFLIITHSKSTMATADALYGITMQEPGVSKRVSVRFEDVVPGENGEASLPAEADGKALEKTQFAYEVDNVPAAQDLPEPAIRPVAAPETGVEDADAVVDAEETPDVTLEQEAPESVGELASS